MKIRFIPATAGTVRLMGDYRWEPGNDYVQDVDAGTAANLLTYPRPDFTVDAQEPLAQIPGLYNRLDELALGGIAGMADLAAIDKAGIAALALATGVDNDTVQAWVKHARLLSKGKSLETEE